MSRETSLSGPLSSDQAAGLLQVSLSETARPIDILLERLAEPKGGAWMMKSLSEQLDREELDLLRGENVTESAIQALKHKIKRRLADAKDQQSHLAALVCYCLVVARGLVSCDCLLSSRSPQEWTDFLADLVGVVPVQWRELVLDAAEIAFRHSK